MKRTHIIEWYDKSADPSDKYAYSSRYDISIGDVIDDFFKAHPTAYILSIGLYEHRDPYCVFSIV